MSALRLKVAACQQLTLRGGATVRIVGVDLQRQVVGLEIVSDQPVVLSRPVEVGSHAPSPVCPRRPSEW